MFARLTGIFKGLSQENTTNNSLPPSLPHSTESLVVQGYVEMLSKKPRSFVATYAVETPAKRQNAIPNEMEVAVSNGDEAALQKLISETDLTTWNKIERIRLMKTAIQNKHYNIVRLFYDRQPTLLEALIQDPQFFSDAALLALVNHDEDLMYSCLFYRERVEFDLLPLLKYAAIAGNEKLVNQLLQKGVLADAVLPDVRSQRKPENVNCIKLLTARSMSAYKELCDALESNTEATVKELLEDGCNPNHLFVNGYIQMTPFSMAMLFDNNGDKKALVKLLLDYGADPDISVVLPETTAKTTPYLFALENGKDEYITLMAPKSNQAWQWLLEYLQAGNVSAVTSYLEHGLAALIEQKGLLRLAVQCHINAQADEAAKKKIEDIISLLVTKYKANPDTITEGKSALELATDLQDQECIKLLLPSSAEARKQLFAMVAKGGEGAIDFVSNMIDYGVDKKALNAENQSLLYIATANNHEDIVEKLLELELDPDVKANDKKSALDVARADKKAKCVALLTPHSLKARVELREAVEKDEKEKANQLISDGVNCHIVLLEALNAGNTECIEGFIKLGFDPDTIIEDGKSLLQIARDKNQQACVKSLTPHSEAAVKELYNAVFGQKIKDATVLLSQGVNPDAKVEEKSSLTVARDSKNQPLIRLVTSYSSTAREELFAAAARGNVKTVGKLKDDGVALEPVMLEALNQNKPDCIDTLLQCGFNPDVIISDKKSALNIAREKNLEECVKLLTPKSNAVIGELNGAVFNGDFATVEKLLKEGAEFAKINSDRLPFFKTYKYNISPDDHPCIIEALRQSRQQQIAKWRKGEKDVEHPDIADLNDEIEALRKRSGEEVNRTEFITSLEKLRDDLQISINKKRKSEDEDSQSFRITKATSDMCLRLRTPRAEGVPLEVYRDYGISILREYEDECKKTPRWTKYARAIGMVIFAAVGFAACAAIGMGLGMVFGAWTGPGAFVTAALGAITGAAAFTAWMTGVTAAAGAGALGAFALSGGLMFKPWGLRKEAVEVAELGNRYVRGRLENLNETL